MGFNAGLTWSTIFATGSILLWFFDLQKISVAFLLILLCSIVGVCITFFSFYNSQNHIEIAVSKYVNNKT